MQKKLYTWLPVTIKETEVNSLIEFIEVTNVFDTKKYYFRGESIFYNSRSASIFRPFKGGNKPEGFSNNFVSFKSLISDYYLQIGNIINNTEKENFLAYSQHHGLLTPLLDVSVNSLVALYFSCEKHHMEPGYVYLFEKENSIDISNFLRGTEWTDILTKLLEKNDIKFIKTLCIGLRNILINDEKDFFLYTYSLGQHMQHLIEKTGSFGVSEKYIESCQKIINLSFPSNSLEVSIDSLLSELEYNNFLNSFVTNKNQKHEFEEFYNEIKKSINLLTDQIDSEDYDLYKVAVYLYCYVTHLRELKSQKISAYDFHNLPSFPQLIYKPTFLFDRMKAQEGIFFYQFGIHKTESVYDSGSIEMQQFLPTAILKINNKTKIMEELDSVGISKKSLFPDVDNIAQYLNESYQKK
ncbi:FRG domain-containing protein [Fundicoccus sp. Sow4_D5]|uniref:FRG domain-containing protein n=1 Tax=Fundicoccus sp. Sow4_D5 TaxID=3438782 RepID=UPI003F93891C